MRRKISPVWTPASVCVVGAMFPFVDMVRGTRVNSDAWPPGSGSSNALCKEIKAGRHQSSLKVGKKRKSGGGGLLVGMTGLDARDRLACHACAPPPDLQLMRVQWLRAPQRRHRGNGGGRWESSPTQQPVQRDQQGRGSITPASSTSSTPGKSAKGSRPTVLHAADHPRHAARADSDALSMFLA
jgi:hypothetical protein